MKRTGKYTDARVESILNLLKKGVTAKGAAMASGISEKTFYLWKRDQPTFVAAVGPEITAARGNLFMEKSRCLAQRCTHLKCCRLGALNGRRKKCPPAQGWEADENQSPHGLSLLGAGTAALAARRGEAGL